jgi:hypothetical protein
MRTLVCLVAFSFGASAATYYVAPNGNDSAAGNEAAPWSTLDKVYNKIVSGDAVYFRAGQWNNQYFWVGKTTGVTNVLICAYPGETVIMANVAPNSVGGSGPSGVAALHMNGPNVNVTFRGIIWSNNWMTCDLQNASGTRFENCQFGWRTSDPSGTNQYGFAYNSFVVWTSTFTTFTNCVFQKWGAANGGNADGCPLSFGCIPSTTGPPDFLPTYQYSSNCWGNVVVDCTFYGGGHDLIEIYSPSNVIRRCKLFNPAWMIDADGTHYWGERHISTMTRMAQPTLVEGCDFGHGANAVDAPNTLACFDVSSSKLILRQSRFFNNIGVCVAFYNKGYEAYPVNNYVYNNSMFLSGLSSTAQTNGYFWYNAAITFPNSPATNNAIVNNVIWQIGPAGTNAAISGIIDSSTNHFANNLLNTVDPLWTSTKCIASNSIPDLHLTAGSPAIDAGAWLTTVTSDSGSGTSFIVNDAGYFYDGWGIPGEVGDTIQLQGQTATNRIIAVDYSSRTLTINATATWTNGQGVALAYSGRAPDIGAFEYGSATALVPPSGLRVTNSSTLSKSKP